MFDFIKKNIYLIILFIITLSIGFLTFLTFIDKGFIDLSEQNLQFLLILNIFFYFYYLFLLSKKLKMPLKMTLIKMAYDLIKNT